MARIRAPFQVGGLVTKPYFIDRDKEVSLLVGDLKGLAQNWVVVAPRRFGKSSLLFNVRQRLTDTPRLLVPWINCLKTTRVENLARRLAESLVEEYERVAGKPGLLIRLKENWGRGMLSALRKIESVSVSLAEFAEIQINMREHSKDEEKAISESLALPGRFAKEKKVKVVLFLDEFNELAALHRRVFHVMKAEMDSSQDVRYVFSGSSLALMNDVFLRDDAPLYMTAGRLELDVLDAAKAAGFVSNRMSSFGLRIGKKEAELICSLTGMVPYYLQKLGQMVFQACRLASRPGVDEKLVRTVFARLLDELDSEFELRWNSRFSQQQRSILEAVSRGNERPVEIARFLATDQRHLTSSLRKLQEAMIIHTVERRISITDPVFSAWIRR